MIKVENLTKKYAGVTAVDDITFTAEPGRVTGFLGPNGAGKSTTMRIMVGLTPASSGPATISGLRYADLPNPGLDVGVLLDAFDVDGLAGAYDAWLVEASRLVDGTGSASRPADDVAAFVVRSRLLHSWRKFLFSDPGLPATLLPRDWPGRRAAAFFDEHAARLLPAANRFIDQCLTPTVAGARP